MKYLLDNSIRLRLLQKLGLEMNENRFNNMGKIYAQFRPCYAQEFIGYLYSRVGLDKNSVIADIGSGTGILTRQLLEMGSRVFAVEPNTDMRSVAEADLGGFSGFVSVSGSAENTTLSDCSVDFITVAQAFHWFDMQRFKAECRRLLKPGGKVVLVWNSRDRTCELVRENDAVNKKYCPKFDGFSGGLRGADGDSDLKDFFAGDCEVKAFRNDLSFDEQGFIGRNLSSSYAPKDVDEHYHDYITELKALYEKFSRNGQLFMPNVTRSYAGRA